MDALLQVIDLTVRYRSSRCEESPALVGVTFAIRAGEAVGLLGESGCGKTSTALSLLGLLPDCARIVGGGVRFRGKMLRELPARDMERIRGAEISLIFQEPSIALNPVLRVGEQIAEVIRAHRPWAPRRCRQEAEELLSQVRLNDISRVFRAFPHELSGGQRQRVLIAQALACKPALVVADEPTTGLDTRTQAEILDLLQELKTRFRTSFLFISHDPRVIAKLADRLLVMYAGRIVEEGDINQVYSSPLHPYTQGLLQSMPGICGEGAPARKRRLSPIPGGPPDMNDLHLGCPFVSRCSARLDLCGVREPRDVELQGARRVRCFLYGN